MSKKKKCFICDGPACIYGAMFDSKTSTARQICVCGFCDESMSLWSELTQEIRKERMEQDEEQYPGGPMNWSRDDDLPGGDE